MGSRHNRKRTRSRPRNRKTPIPGPYAQHMIFISPFSPQQPSPFSSGYVLNNNNSTAVKQQPQQHSPSPFHYYSQSLSQPQQQLRQQMRQRHQDEATIEAERVRMFGGEKGDTDSLCGPMLRVVMDLFEGEVDYVDP